MSLEVIVLAAGQGSRMKSRLPKVLHPLAGKPMLAHVLDTAQSLRPDRIHLVIGHGADRVREAVAERPVSVVLQPEQLGTGHAVDQAMPQVDEQATVLVLYGDVPLIGADTLQGLSESAATGALALLTVELEDPTGYGRIVRDHEHRVRAIVEHKDASEAELAIREVNTGIMALPARLLKQWLPRLSADNAQGEYYLTDIIAMAAAEGVSIATAHPRCCEEVQGVNDRAQLAALERWHQRRQAEAWLRGGVTLADPARVDFRGDIRIAPDVSIDINVVLEGRVEIEEGAVIGPNCLIRDSRIGAGAIIKANSVLEEAVVGEGCEVGPFARLRPGTELGPRARIGNFVETKKAQVGAGSKINHLSYVGDAVLGRDVNVGAGTITCNYDGVNKFRTEIGDRAFIGSNTSLVAPVQVGAGATTGAGSVITKTVGDDELAVARGRQTNIRGWKRPARKS